MHQTILCRWVLKGALALAVVACGVSDAAAGWGSNGSWGGGSMGGGSSGGWGSSGGYSAGWGSTGGFGSSGGVARRGLFHHHHRARFGGGSSGGWGSTGGGSSGGSGSSGGYGWSGGSSGGFAAGGSSGGWGSSGGAVMGGGYYSPSYIVPEGDQPLDPPPAPMDPPVDGDSLPPMEDGTSLRRADGTLVVEVPVDAKIYVNNRLTSTPGEVREYVSKNLIRGYNYTYEVRAELEVDGKTVTETKKIDLRAGQHQKLAFNLNPAASEVETSITVKVPANAKVNLGGNDTNAQGETRVFRTSALRDGAEWKDYKIVVTAEVDGREITKEQSFDLKAGENKELHFDFDAASVADLR